MQTTVRHTTRRHRRGNGLFRSRVTAVAALIGVAMAANAQDTGGPFIAGTTEPDADQRRYTVELIVFTYGPGVSSGTEVFIPDEVAEMPAGIPAENVDPYAAIDLSGTGIDAAGDVDVPEYGDLMPAFPDEDIEELIAADRISLRVLTPDELTLGDAYEQLTRLDAYTPVLWAGWTQTTLEQEATPSIRLRRLGSIPLQFKGDLKLYLSRYLHLVIDIAMEEDTVAASAMPRSGATGRGAIYPGDAYLAQEAPVVQFRIAEDRIVKSGDLRYFDHPKFGVLAKVTRAESIEAVAPETGFYPPPGEVSGLPD